MFLQQAKMNADTLLAERDAEILVLKEQLAQPVQANQELEAQMQTLAQQLDTAGKAAELQARELEQLRHQHRSIADGIAQQYAEKANECQAEHQTALSRLQDELAQEQRLSASYKLASDRAERRQQELHERLQFTADLRTADLQHFQASLEAETRKRYEVSSLLQQVHDDHAELAREERTLQLQVQALTENLRLERQNAANREQIFGQESQQMKALHEAASAEIAELRVQGRRNQEAHSATIISLKKELEQQAATNTNLQQRSQLDLALLKAEYENEIAGLSSQVEQLQRCNASWQEEVHHITDTFEQTLQTYQEKLVREERENSVLRERVERLRQRRFSDQILASD
eukprot:m.620835 g.620835  ORF g.620835 m.620835 type:complete len:347 (+) comp58209_c0_seq24:1-1041(+)